MKRPFSPSPLVLFLVAAGAQVAAAQAVLQPNDRVVIAGDSITEQKIYSGYIEQYLLMCEPTPGLTVVGEGWSRESAYGFWKRVESDIAPFKPTVVTTCYGMNDGNYVGINQVTADQYREYQLNGIEALKKAGVRVIVLGSPKCVDSHSYHGGEAGAAEIYNGTLGNFARIDRELAQSEGVIYAPVFEETMATMTKAKAEKGDAYNVGGADGVHPAENGSLVMACTFLKALGCDGAIGTLTVDLASKQAESTPGHKIVSFQDGTLTVESTRYPFCFSGDPEAKDDNPASIVKYTPFNQDLNRYLLVVKHLPTPKARITWGSGSKEFTADQLAKGINLAAEFVMENPFAGQQKKVADAVLRQQANETFLMKRFLHAFSDLQDMAGTEAPELDKVLDAAMQKDHALQADARNLVIPLQHTIKIEPIAQN